MVRSRVATSVDAGRLGEMLARPGMDTRVWVSLATVVETDISTDGAFADVTLLPSGDKETVRIGMEYAGNGFGRNSPIKADDEVVVLFPGGDPDAGGVIVARLHNKSDPPPTLAINSPKDVVEIVESGNNYQLNTSGAGQVKVETKGTGQVEVKTSSGAINLTPGSTVNLGGPTAVDAVMKGTSFNAANATMLAVIKIAFDKLGADPALDVKNTRPYCVAASGAVVTFLGLASSFLATKAKVI